MNFDLAAIFSFANVSANFMGTLIGIVFGAIPGISTAMTLALFLPFTFGMEPVQALGFLMGIYVGGNYGGAITAILIKTPGTPAAAATVLDGYPLAQQGKAKEAISIATIGSVIGGMVGSVFLIVFAPMIASVALVFGPAEFFAIGLFGLSMISSLSSDNFLKGIIAACIGLLLATVGMDPITGSIRMTFGSRTMISGIEFISVMIGLFAISEILLKLEKIVKERAVGPMALSGNIVSFKVIKQNALNIARSCLIGLGVGIIPAIGTGTGAWISYNEAKRASKNKEEFGKGSREGIFAAETANTAVTGGSLVPTLTLGIPGDVMTAVMLGAFLIQGLTPGPALFRDHPDVVTGIYVMFIISDIFVLILGFLGIRVFASILKIPIDFLMTCVVVVCLLGAYAYNLSVFSMRIALVMGVVGYIFNKAKFPIPPIILGLILGPLVESNFRRALTISRGSFDIFLRPISATFIFIAMMAFIWPIISKQYKKYKAHKKAQAT